MKISPYLFVFCFFVISCKNHLGEKVIRNNGITVRWYRISEITSMHDFVDLERDGYTHPIMQVNTGDIQGITINNDTVIIKAKAHAMIYSMAAYEQRTYIRLDSSESH